MKILLLNTVTYSGFRVKRGAADDSLTGEEEKHRCLTSELTTKDKNLKGLVGVKILPMRFPEDKRKDD